MALNLTGISNENEFYTHHYLSAILETDLKEVFEKWPLESRRKNSSLLIPSSVAWLGSIWAYATAWSECGGRRTG